MSGGRGLPDSLTFVLLAEFYIFFCQKTTGRDLESHFLMEISFFFFLLSFLSVFFPSSFFFLFLNCIFEEQDMYMESLLVIRLSWYI